jgi:hypothetical protein
MASVSRAGGADDRFFAGEPLGGGLGGGQVVEEPDRGRAGAAEDRQGSAGVAQRIERLADVRAQRARRRLEVD